MTGPLGFHGNPVGWKQMLWESILWGCKRNAEMKFIFSVIFPLPCLQWRKESDNSFLQIPNPVMAQNSMPASIFRDYH